MISIAFFMGIKPRYAYLPEKTAAVASDSPRTMARVRDLIPSQPSTAVCRAIVPSAKCKTASPGKKGISEVPPSTLSQSRTRAIFRLPHIDQLLAELRNTIRNQLHQLVQKVRSMDTPSRPLSGRYGVELLPEFYLISVSF
jgi:hypothetical protein